MRPSGTIYVILRKVVYVGAPVRFTRLMKVHVYNIFLKGKVEAEVDVDDVQTARELRDQLKR